MRRRSESSVWEIRQYTITMSSLDSSERIADKLAWSDIGSYGVSFEHVRRRA